MGVMSCHRKDCENVMCDTYIQQVGHICWECQSEFEEKYGQRKLSKGKLIKKLIKFMESPSAIEGSSDVVEVSEFFRSHTK